MFDLIFFQWHIKITTLYYLCSILHLLNFEFTLFIFFHPFKESFFSLRTMAFFHRYHRRRLIFPLKVFITLSSMSVTCRLDRCHRLQFKPKPSYFHHLTVGRVAAVHEEASLPRRWRPRRCWRTLQRQRRRRRLRPSRVGRNERRKERLGWLLPGTVWQHNDSVCGGGNGVVANGGRADFTGDLNVGLERMGGRWLDKEIALVVETVGIEDISAHFLQKWRAWNWYQRPWAVVKQGRLMRSRTDYILGSDHQIFQNVDVQKPPHKSGPLHGHGVSAFRLPKV